MDLPFNISRYNQSLLLPQRHGIEDTYESYKDRPFKASIVPSKPGISFTPFLVGMLGENSRGDFVDEKENPHPSNSVLYFFINLSSITILNLRVAPSADERQTPPRPPPT